MKILENIRCLNCNELTPKYRWGKNKPSKFCSRDCKDKWQINQTEDRTSQWKGEKAKYGSKHMWMRRNYGNANMCWNSECDSKSTFYEWANINHEYIRELSDWVMLCRKCHIRHDREKFGTRENNGWNFRGVGNPKRFK